jgi:hypothetical protein
MPLSEMNYDELVENGESLMQQAKDVLLHGMEGMGAKVPWLAPLPTSGNVSFNFGGGEPLKLTGPHFFGGPSGGGM